jgi:hypothetical protein
VDVRIEELTTTVSAVDPESLLTPAVVARLVDAVCVHLAARSRSAQVSESERDLRSVVDQQRAGRD